LEDHIIIRLSLFFVAHERKYYRCDDEYTPLLGPYIIQEQAVAAAGTITPDPEWINDDYESNRIVVLEADLDERHIGVKEY